MATKTDNQSELRTVTTTVPSTESSTATEGKIRLVDRRQRF